MEKLTLEITLLCFMILHNEFEKAREEKILKCIEKLKNNRWKTVFSIIFFLLEISINFLWFQGGIESDDGFDTEKLGKIQLGKLTS
jgi:hypothetical protein